MLGSIPHTMTHLKLVDEFKVQVVEVGLCTNALHHQVVREPRVMFRMVLHVRLDIVHLRGASAGNASATLIRRFLHHSPLRATGNAVYSSPATQKTIEAD